MLQKVLSAERLSKRACSSHWRSVFLASVEVEKTAVDLCFLPCRSFEASFR